MSDEHGHLTARTPKPKPRPRAILNRHAHCVDHLRLDGYDEPVCVARGVDPDIVRRFAAELVRRRDARGGSE